MPKLIALEGIIASGKTTILPKIQRRLQTYCRVEVAPEPTAAWQNAYTFTCSFPKFEHTTEISDTDQFDLLSMMYHDPQRWSLTFQLWALFTRIKSIEAILHESGDDLDVLIVERVPTVNRIFAKLLFEQGAFTECEWLIYEHLFANLVAGYRQTTHGLVYLECPVQTAMERIQKRNRNGESLITYEYQTSLTRKYKQWLSEQQDNMPTHLVPMTNDDNDDMITDIAQFIIACKY